MKETTPQNWLAAHLSANLPYPLAYTIEAVPGGREEHAESLAEGIKAATYISQEHLEELFGNHYINKYRRCVCALAGRHELTEDMALYILRNALLVKMDVSDHHADDIDTVTALAGNPGLAQSTTGGEYNCKETELRSFLINALGESVLNVPTARQMAKKAADVYKDRVRDAADITDEAPGWTSEENGISREFLNPVPAPFFDVPYVSAGEAAEALSYTKGRINQIVRKIDGAFKNRSGWQVPNGWVEAQRLKPKPNPGPQKS